MSKCTYKPSHIANFFLQIAQKEGVEITPLKLLKLVYIGYGWVLAVSDRKLFDEPIEAWKHGPVIPSLYNEFKHYGKSPIDQFATEFDLESFELTTPEIETNDNDALMILNKVWITYRYVKAWALRSKTHEQGTPWTTTYLNGAGNGSTIPSELIQVHFQQKITEYLAEAA